MLLAVSLAAAVALRFYGIAQQSFDEDETVTVWLTHHSLLGMLKTIPRTESTPPLYYILAWVWTRLFGTGAGGIRSLSACLGVATVPVIYLAARELAGRWAGNIAALLAALSPAFIWYSQEARAYALLALSIAASLLFFARALRTLREEAPASGTPSLKASLYWWGLWASLALLSHYFALFLVGAQGLWLLIAGWRRRRSLVIRSLAPVLVVGLLLLPLAQAQQARGGDDWIGRISLGGRLMDVPPQLLLGDGRPLYRFFALAVGLAAIVPAAWTILRGTGRTRWPVMVPAIVGVTGVALPAGVDLAGMHVLLDRNELGAGVALLIACAIGMALCRPAWLGLAAVLAVCALFAWDLETVHTNRLLQREDWRDAAHALGEANLPRAILYGPATNNPSPTPPLVPFQAVYLKTMLTMPDRGWTVREIDVLNVRDDLSDTSPPPEPVSPGRGCRLVELLRGQPFTLFRFVSSTPVHVNPDVLMSQGLLQNREEEESLVGLQLPKS